MDDATDCVDSISLASLVTTTEFPPPKVFCPLSLLSDCRTLSRLKPGIATSSLFSSLKEVMISFFVKIFAQGEVVHLSLTA